MHKFTLKSGKLNGRISAWPEILERRLLTTSALVVSIGAEITNVDIYNIIKIFNYYIKQLWKFQFTFSIIKKYIFIIFI